VTVWRRQGNRTTGEIFGDVPDAVAVITLTLTEVEALLRGAAAGVGADAAGLEQLWVVALAPLVAGCRLARHGAELLPG
jgi:hypothetical protein